MKLSKGVTIWALLATVALAVSLAWPDAPRRGLDALAQAGRTRLAQAQTADAPAQLEWLGWMFFRLTSPRGKVILFSPWLNDPQAPFSNRESPLRLENLDLAHVILVPAGHGDDSAFLIEAAHREGVVRRFTPYSIMRHDDGLISMEERLIDLSTDRSETRVTMLHGDGRRTEHRYSVRLYTLRELAEMLKVAGLRMEASYGGLDRSALTLDSRRLVILSRKS